MKANRKIVLALSLILLVSGCSKQSKPQATSSTTPSRSAGVESSYGDISWVMPASWKKVIPRVWSAPVGPLVFMSNAQIIDPCASSFRVNACWKPLKKLPSNSILVTFEGSAIGRQDLLVPLKVAVRLNCQDMAGERDFVAFFRGVGIEACLRGPDFTANEALFQQLMSSLKKA